MEQTSDALMELDAPALRVVAAHFEARARILRARAAELEIIANNEQIGRELVARAYQSHELVSSYLCSGMTLDQAILAASSASGFPLETIRHHWQRFLRDADHKATQARHHLVMRFAGRGWSNEEIARKTGLHPVSISRIIGKRLRQG